jgi:hypothetical protein
MTDEELKRMSWVWWYMPVILALGRLRWEDHEFKASLCYRAS